jgi:hypothetical protein
MKIVVHFGVLNINSLNFARCQYIVKNLNLLNLLLSIQTTGLQFEIKLHA